MKNWDVLTYVARRYGPYQADIYSKRAEKLDLFRKGLLGISDLEDDNERFRKRLLREPGSPKQKLERLIGSSNFQDKYVLDQLSSIATSVGRILQKGVPIGTGFLVAENIILTNHHVIGSPFETLNTVIEFDYELESNGRVKPTLTFDLDPKVFFLTSSIEVEPDILHSGLDFTLIGLNDIGTNGTRISRYKPIFLDGNSGKIVKGESCVVIQHPNGLPKKVVLKDNLLFSETNTRMVYETDTLPGSSGSPVIALGTGEVFALHHSGLPRTDDQNNILTISGTIANASTPDDQIDWLGNEGIKISRIILAVMEANLPLEMEKGRKSILERTESISPQMGGVILTTRFSSETSSEEDSGEIISERSIKEILSELSINKSHFSTRTHVMTDFIILTIYSAPNIQRLNAQLSQRFGGDIQLQLVMPNVANEGESELFITTLPVVIKDAHQIARELIQIPGIMAAEVDLPLYLNGNDQFLFQQEKSLRKEESGLRDIIWEDGLGRNNEEDEFLPIFGKSQYIKGKTPIERRRWNWEATNFELNNATLPPHDKIRDVRIVQFDTGYAQHSKIDGGFDTDHDYNFVNNTDDAKDELTPGILKFPRHGVRTGSILIGNVDLLRKNEGNEGLLLRFGYKLTPYRIAESVILINRQQELASALDRAIRQGFDIITMSMGLPPTISTAQMARKAYEKGIIWCCAAGNEVQFVVAPAVYPGTIAVAASNPFDEEWKGSSRGNMVDITAPGEAVYVPIWSKNENGFFEDYSYGDGTSFATPHVAAAAALWLAKYEHDLIGKGYLGWKRVEAFRYALKKSARPIHKTSLPKEGFGSGILDVEALLNTPPPKANVLKHAYEGWSDHAFFQAMQGYSEILKTYWNKFFNRGEKTSTSPQESLPTGTLELSPFSQQLELTLFNKSPLRRRITESNRPATETETLERLNHLHDLLFNPSQK